MMLSKREGGSWGSAPLRNVYITLADCSCEVTSQITDYQINEANSFRQEMLKNLTIATQARRGLDDYTPKLLQHYL